MYTNYSKKKKTKLHIKLLILFFEQYMYTKNTLSTQLNESDK